MSDFKRELRYFIFKTKHLTQEQHEQLLGIADSINPPPLECVVVESDWPNYEDTWKAVEQVANGEYQSPYDLIEQQRARIAELEQREQELAATVDALQEAMYKTGDLLIKLGKIKEFQELNHALCSTPPQNLNAVKRSALLELANGLKNNDPYTPALIGSGDIRKYANTNYPSDKE